MISYIESITNSYQTIIRPIAESVITNLTNKIGGEYGDMVIERNYYTGELKQRNKNKDTIVEDSKLSDIRFTIGVENKLINMSQIGMGIINGQNKPLITSDYFRISTISGPTEFRLNVLLESKFESFMSDFVNNTQARFSIGNESSFHNVEYLIYPTANIIFLLRTLANNRNKVEPIEFTDFLKEVVDSRAKIVTDINGEQPTIAFKEVITNVECILETNPSDMTIAFDRDTGIYSLEYELRFVVDTPIQFLVEYEPLYYNTTLPKNFLDIATRKLKKRIINVPKDLQSLNSFREENQTYNKLLQNTLDTFVKIPEYDNFNTITSSVTTIMFTVLVEITPDDKRSLFNLNDIEEFGYELDPFLKQFIMESEREYITKHKESIIELTLYENNQPILDVLEIDEDLNIKAKRDLDISKIYRVAFGINRNLDILSQRAKNAYKEYQSYLDNHIGILYKDRFFNNALIRWESNYIDILNNIDKIKETILSRGTSGQEVENVEALYTYLVNSLIVYINKSCDNFTFPTYNEVKVITRKYYTLYTKDDFTLIYSQQFNTIVMIKDNIKSIYLKNTLSIICDDKVFTYIDDKLVPEQTLVTYPFSIFYPSNSLVIVESKIEANPMKTVEYFHNTVIRRNR
jgi:hypothetical protein